MTRTEEAEEIARTLGVEFSVALDVLYLRGLEHRVVSVARNHSALRDFPVLHESLEQFLESYEQMSPPEKTAVQP